MPVKWTPDNDQMLLLKILETHPALSVDTKAVSEAWPSNLEKPSARAITERLVRIRKNAGIQFTVKSAQATKGPSSPNGAKGVTGTTPTPRKGRAKAAPTEETGSAGGKRKRGGKAVRKENGDGEHDDGAVKVSAKEAETLQQEASTRYGDGIAAEEDVTMGGNAENAGWGEEDGEENGEEDLESPSKRARVGREDLSMAKSPLEGVSAEDEEDVSQYEEV
ncbi:MAG: hypothetical protein M1816_000749 [Peltula sp. TS41687]|nr:MAG: hypothetical protein M1816_000749 [Peltula sp. TS41687]